MDDTLLLYRNAKVEDTTAYDYSAKIFLKDTIPSASSLIARGLQNGDKFIFHTGRVTTIYSLGTMNSSVPAGYISVALSGKVVYCEEDMCFYKFTNAIPYMHYIYQPSVPFNFHNTSEQIYLKDFTYTAERMGKTPTLTADFYDKECYDNLWDTNNFRFYDIFTVFRGERYYFKLTPQSQLQNTDARYKHTINFVSEREKLEHAKMFDIVTTTTPDTPVSDSSKFVFYGTLSEFADRINASLIKEGITYSATYNDNTIYSGYHVVIDDDVTEEQRTTDATVSIENNSILQALDHLDTDYGVSYYVVGYEIHIGDKQADLTGTGHPALEYGADDSLIQITRQNVTKDIITRITGYGSEDNIPYYYPNPSESGFIQGKYEKFGESVRNISSSNPSTSGATLNELYIKLGTNNIGGTLYKFDGTAWVALCDVPRGRVYYNVANGTLNVCNVSSGAWESPSVPTLRHPYEWVKVGNNVMPATKLIFVSTSVTQNASLPSYADEGDMCYIGKRSSNYRKIYTYTNGAWDSGETPSSNTCYMYNNVLYMYKTVSGTTTLYSVTGDYDKFVQLSKSDEFVFGKYIRPIIGKVDKTTGNVNINGTYYHKEDGVYQYDGSYCFDINFETTVFDSDQLYVLLDEFYPYIGQQGGDYRCELVFVTIDNAVISDVQNLLFAHREVSFNGIAKIGITIRQRMPYNVTRFFYGWHFDRENNVIVCSHSVRQYIRRNYPACIATIDDFRKVLTDTYLENGGANNQNTSWNAYNYVLARMKKSSLWKMIEVQSNEQPASHQWYLNPSLGANYRAWCYGTLTNNDWSASWNYEKLGDFNGIELRNGDICEEANADDIYESTNTFYQYNSSTGTFSQISNPYSDPMWRKIVDIYSGITEVYIRYYNKKWYKNNDTATLPTYGLTLTGTAAVGDKITFEQIKYMQPQKNLMPSIYYRSDAQKRFFDAVLYPHARVRGVMLDREGGEYYIDESIVSSDNGKVANENYRANTNTFYDFENVIDRGHPRTHVETIGDVKPSIEGLTATVGGQELRVDLFEEFCYDERDSDDNWSAYERREGDDSNLTLKHPHFFAKLRPLGFNLFAMAIDEDEMVVNFKSGCCMACSFKVKVDTNDGVKNPIRLFGVDVYRRDDNGVMALWYNAGTPQRYSDRMLYKLVNGNFVEAREEYMPPVDDSNSANSPRMDGDVVTVRYVLDNVQASQQDTTTNYVWIALEKDISTFSYPMPSVANNMKPKAFDDTSSEDDSDKFVLTHIKMPLRFVRAAEERLSKALVEYMSKNNAELFHYSIKFSRIFLSESANTYADDLNENVKLHILYADHSEKSFYVKSYTYKKVGSEPLPEISVELRENINVVRYRYSNRIDITRWDGQFEEMIRTEPILRTIAGNGNGNGFSIVGGNLIANLSRHLVSRNGSMLRGVLQTTSSSKIVGNVNIVRDNGRHIPIRQIDKTLGVDEDSGVRGKAKNLLTDLGILEFDETRSYEIDEMVVRKNRIMRFTQKKTAGEWDATKATNDSISNCIFRAIGVQEYNPNKTTEYKKKEKFFRNGKVYTVTTAFKPMDGTTPVSSTVFSNSTRQMDIVSTFSEISNSETMQSTIDNLSRVVGNLSAQVLDENSGLAVMVQNVNSALANLTAEMALDSGLSQTTQQAASTANTAITGSNTDSEYNKALSIIADKMFGVLVSEVFNSMSSSVVIIEKLYGQTQYANGIPVEFDSTPSYEANQLVIHDKHIYLLTNGKDYNIGWDEIDPATIENEDAILQKMVLFSTDEYNMSGGSQFMEYGMFTMANSLCEYILKFVSDNGDKGILYTELAELVTKQSEEYTDGSGANMFTEHTAREIEENKVYYTVLQYAVMRMELNNNLYTASTYTEELVQDDNHHILFEGNVIKQMGDNVVEFMEQQPTEEIEIAGETILCYYVEMEGMADKFGYNYLYASDFLVDEGVMYYDNNQKKYYLPV